MKPDLALLWSGQFLSRLAAVAVGVAASFLLKSLAQSPAWNGWLLFLTFAPGLLCAPVAGVLADRVQPRRMLMACDVAAAIPLILLAALVLIRPELTGLAAVALLLTVACGSVTDAFYRPTEDVMLAELVAPRHLSTAYTIDESTMHAAQFTGASLGGLLFASLGAGLVFAGGALSCLMAAILIWAVRYRRPVRDHDTESVAIMVQIRVGLRVFHHNHGFALFSLMMAVIIALAMTWAILAPFLIEDHLHLNASWVAVFSIAMVIGGFTGMLMSGWRRLDGAARPWVVVAALIGFGLGSSLFWWTRDPWVVVALSVLGSAVMGFVMIQSRTLAMLSTPQDVRGRVMAWLGTLQGLAMVIAMPIIGHISELLDPSLRIPVMFSASGAGIAVIGIVLAGTTSARNYLRLSITTDPQ